MKEKYLKRLKEIYIFINKHYDDTNPEMIAIYKFFGDLIRDIEMEEQ